MFSVQCLRIIVRVGSMNTGCGSSESNGGENYEYCSEVSHVGKEGKRESKSKS